MTSLRAGMWSIICLIHLPYPSIYPPSGLHSAAEVVGWEMLIKFNFIPCEKSRFTAWSRLPLSSEPASGAIITRQIAVCIFPSLWCIFLHTVEHILIFPLMPCPGAMWWGRMFRDFSGQTLRVQLRICCSFMEYGWARPELPGRFVPLNLKWEK